MSKWVVKQAEAQDKAWVFEQCAAFLNEVDVGVPFHEKQLNVLWETPAIKKLVVYKDGVPVGLGVYSLSPHMFNPDIVVFTELVWWVVPEHRGSRAGLILLDAMDTLAKQCANIVCFSVEATSLVNYKCLQKRGYKKQEVSFLKKVN